MAADDDTTTAPATASPDLLAQAMQLAKQFMPQQVQQDTTPVSRSWTSLLGQALAGGAPVAGMSDADKETAGSRALMNFGTSLMAASRYQPGQTIFSNLASGLQGAQQGEIGAEEMAMAKLGAQQEYAQQQGQNKLEAIKTALPFLRMQQGAGMPNLLAGGGAPPAPNVAQGGSIADPAAALPKDQALAAVVQRESGGKNIPTAILGPDGKPASTATGYYQMLDNTWQEGATLAGIKNPPPRAMDASKADQDAAASALYDKYKLMPWAKSAPTPTAPSGSPPASTASTTPPAPVVHTSPTLRGPGTPVPPTPQPSIQGVPDSGGTQVGGPGALPGKVAPPGPAGPGDVNAIIAGMKGAGASPTTLAPGAATAGPTAPPASTVVAANPPAPQTPTQADQPPAPTGPMTFEQFRAQHPIAVDPSTFTVTPPSGALADAIAAKQTAAQNLQQARLSGDSKAENQAQANFTTASQNFNKLQQDAQSKSLELQQAAQKNALDTQRQLYNDEMTRQQQAELKAQELAQQVAEKEKDRQAEIEKARVQLGLNIEQKGAEAGLAESQQTLTDMSKASTEARAAGNQLRLMPGIVDQLPQPGFAAQLAKDHPALIPWLTQAGALSPEQADATQVMRGLIGYMSVGLRPTGSGALRNAEMDRFQAVLPDLMQSPQGRKDSLSLLQTLQDRIVQEHDFASRYFRRPDPTTGKPSYNLDGLPDAIDAPRSQGGLGPIAPTGPQPVTTDANGQARRMTTQEVQQWVHDNVGVGHAYWGWAPVGDGTYKQKLMVRRDHG